jgi:nucleoside-diphosphate-sugar epimerase
MRRLLVAGCGYLGQAVADLFHHAGWEVEGWTRSIESAEQVSMKPYAVEVVELSNREQVSSRAKNFDVIIHCASTRGKVDLYRSVYLIGAQNLLSRFPESTILFTSSTSVYAQKNGEWVTEQSAAEPNHPSGKILRETERLLLDHAGVVARLAGIYGPGRAALLKKFLSGEAMVDWETDRFVNQIHRDDAAAALFFLLDQHLTPGEIYNVVDDQPILQSECYRWLAEKLNRPWPATGRSTRLRAATARQASKGKRGQSNKRVSNAKLRGLGWTPRFPSFAQAMEKSVLPSLKNLGA